jgi:AcrR family transcriptional regulator
MARPREFDADEALIQIRDAFWASGYDATSLSDLVQATGVKKASLYGAFGGKQIMYRKALVDYERVHVQACVNMMGELRGRAALKALFFAPVTAVANGDRRGCFLCNSSGEYASLDEASREVSDRGHAAMLDAIGKALAEIDHKTIEPGEVLALYVGLRVLARSSMSEDMLRGIAQSAIGRI